MNLMIFCGENNTLMNNILNNEMNGMNATIDSKISDNKRRVSENQMSFSFTGCGFLSFYYLGVNSCLRQFKPIRNNQTIICGASSGALAALTLCLDLCLDQTTLQLLEVVDRVGSRPLGLVHPSVNLHTMMYSGLLKLLPDDCYKRATGRLFISVTRVSDGKNVLISQFDSKEELIRAIQCSCFLPFLSGLVPPKYRGTAYIDGALSNNMPKYDENTITIGPWSGEFDICPLNDISIPFEVMFYNKLIALSPFNVHRIRQIAFPPDWDSQPKLCQQGFDDALRFLQKITIIPCNQCMKIDIKLNTIKEEDTEDKNWTECINMCQNCPGRVQISGIDSLPENIIKAIQEACDRVNKDLRQSLTRHRPIRLLTIVLIPFLLWFELIMALVSGVLLNDWSFGIFIDILNITRILISNGNFK